MTPRAPKPNETIKKSNRYSLEYVDELGRNTYYFNRHTEVWYEKLWLRLPNGEDVETSVEGSNGYFRRHWYDVHTGELLREIDSNAETNLIDKRRQWNPRDSRTSLENLNKKRQEPRPSKELF